jgi:hypothetical protein
MIGLVLIIAGFLLWLLGGYVLIGLILIILGIVLAFVPGVPYGYPYRGRRGPPV